MQDIDWAIVPSTWWEIFGLVVSEAWMFGRPVIASAIAALEERVIPDLNGFTFPARDARALADLMASLVGNEDRWRAVNASIEQPWSDTEMLDAHLSVWEEAAQEKASRISRNGCGGAGRARRGIFREPAGGGHGVGAGGGSRGAGQAEAQGRAA